MGSNLFARLVILAVMTNHGKRIGRHLLFALFALAFEARAQGVSETWVGGIASGGFVAIRLNIADKIATVDFTNQGLDRQNLPLSTFQITDSTFHVEWKDTDDVIVLDGHRHRVSNQDVAEGTFAQETQKGKFFLTRGARVDRDEITKDYGLYKFADGTFLWIGSVSELNRRPGFVNSRSGKLGALYPAGMDRYFSGESSLVPFPIGATGMVMQRDTLGRPMQIRWREGRQPPRTAIRADVYRTEDVAFNNDTVRLDGTLITPVGRGPFPAVVFIHGSGGSTREYFSSLPYLLASRGIASLIYDKRGSGKSTGNRHISPFESLADDALAGVRLIAKRSNIDPRRIGVYGHSQGGWVAPLAAHRSNGSVAFVVAVAGPAQDFQKQTNDEIQSGVRDEGLGEDAVRDVTAYQDLWWSVYRGQAPQGQLVALSDHQKAKAWYRYTFGTKNTLDPPGAYDPAPVLRGLHIPVLAIYGGSDNRVFAGKNARLMRSALSDARNNLSTVKIFENADHDLILAPQNEHDSYLQTSRYADGYLEYLVSWITLRTLPRHSKQTQ